MASVSDAAKLASASNAAKLATASPDAKTCCSRNSSKSLNAWSKSSRPHHEHCDKEELILPSQHNSLRRK